jgi:RNA recognition motif-containing protein
MSKAIGFVEMATVQEVRRAVDQLNGKEFAGQVIQVSEFNTVFERVKRSCADVASQMQCPHHFTNAKVEMTGESFDDFSMEVITCCEEFRRRVEEALDKLVPHPAASLRRPRR